MRVERIDISAFQNDIVTAERGKWRGNPRAEEHKPKQVSGHRDSFPIWCAVARGNHRSIHHCENRLAPGERGIDGYCGNNMSEQAHPIVGGSLVVNGQEIKCKLRVAWRIQDRPLTTYRRIECERLAHCYGAQRKSEGLRAFAQSHSTGRLDPDDFI